MPSDPRRGWRRSERISSPGGEAREMIRIVSVGQSAGKAVEDSASHRHEHEARWVDLPTIKDQERVLSCRQRAECKTPTHLDPARYLPPGPRTSTHSHSDPIRSLPTPPAPPLGSIRSRHQAEGRQDSTYLLDRCEGCDGISKSRIEDVRHHDACMCQGSL